MRGGWCMAPTSAPAPRTSMAARRGLTSAALFTRPFACGRSPTGNAGARPSLTTPNAVRPQPCSAPPKPPARPSKWTSCASMPASCRPPTAWRAPAPAAPRSPSLFTRATPFQQRHHLELRQRPDLHAAQQRERYLQHARPLPRHPHRLRFSTSCQPAVVGRDTVTVIGLPRAAARPRPDRVPRQLGYAHGGGRFAGAVRHLYSGARPRASTPPAARR